jgi:hypothetical protein
MEEQGRDDLIDYEDSLKKERMEMEKLEAHFEERTSKLASQMMIPWDGVDLMDVDKLMDGGEENMANGEVENSKEEENELDQFKIVHYKKEAVHKLLGSNVRVEDRCMKILDKATAKKGLELKKTSLSSSPYSSFTVFNSFDPLHFVNMASYSGIILGNDMNSEREVVNVMLAKENAEAMLTEAKKRRAGRNKKKVYRL